MLSLLSLAGRLALGNRLSQMVARPRPSPELVRVLRPLTGFSFPSQFALRYAAVFGFLTVLAALKCSGPRGLGWLAGCGALLMLGGAARIALGSHWPSDVLIPYYLGILRAAFLIRLVFPSDR